MCGIIGTFGRIGSPYLLTNEDLNRIKHRGPDGRGIYNDDQVSLGHVRLSIIDLSNDGSQPMNYRNRYWITYNGEIYNYIELRDELQKLGFQFSTKSDTEVLLAAYAHWGEDCLLRINGMFAFAIWDTADKVLFLARDRFGEKPIIFCRSKDSFVFASEFKALVPMLTTEPKINLEAVDMFLHFQFVPEPFTLINGVKKIPAGHFLKLSRSNWDAEPVAYWSIDQESPTTVVKKLANRNEEIKDHLESAVKYCLRSDVKVGIALSGGIDSGAIASIASKTSNIPLHAFTIGYPGRPPYDERNQALELAKQLGIVVHEVELTEEKFVKFFPEFISILDEPIADIAAFAHYAVPKAAHDNGFKVLLTGIGGDEIFWGYGWVARLAILNQEKLKWYYNKPSALIEKNSLLHKVLIRIAKSHKTPSKIQYFASILSDLCSMGPIPADQMYFYEMIPDYLYAKGVAKKIYQKDMLHISKENFFSPFRVGIKSKKETPVAVMKILLNTWLVSNCLNLGDRVSMALGVESRLPFLDAKLAEAVTKFRENIEDHRLLPKAWLREALIGTLPEEVLNRPKRGFQPPVIDWLLGIVNQYYDVLPNGFLNSAGIINLNEVEELYKQRNTKVWAPLFYLYKLIMLELWCSRYIKRDFSQSL
jgi:asparagine synthase (glutamine-hydrolysing)